MDPGLRTAGMTTFLEWLNMASKRDYYELLGLAKTAGADEIKLAYRRQAVKYHPDKNPGDKTAEAQFKAINEAYEVLSDPNKRAAYDRFGHDGVSNQPGAGAGGFGGGFEGFGNVGDIDLGDILGNIFGGGGGAEAQFGGQRRGGGRGSRGQDIAVEVEVSLREAFEGGKKAIKLDKLESCDTCHGSGAKPGTKPVTCRTCGGQGQVRTQRSIFMMQQTCPTCHGEGQMVEAPCPTCRGAGAQEKTSTITVRIPAGVREGTSLKIAGNGQAGSRGRPAGDLYVVVHVEKDNFFTRDGDDLYTEEHISIPQASLGCEISVRTMEDKLSIKIPPGTQSGALFRLREKGMPRLTSRGFGDQFVKVLIDIPKKMSSTQRDAMVQLAKALGENTTQYDESVLGKLFGRG